MFQNPQNEQILETLLRQAAEAHVSHAYLLLSEDPAVLQAAADRFAAALVKTPADRVDVTHAKPNLITVDDVREGINRTVMVRPYGSDYKVYIVREAELMNAQAQNALLKTLEEPPDYTVILLLTGNEDAFLPTVLSRCVKLTFFPEEKSGEAADDTLSELRREVRNYMDSIPFRDVRSLVRLTDYAGKNKILYRELLEEVQAWIRDILVYKTGKNAADLIHGDALSTVRTLAGCVSYERGGRVLALLSKARRMAELNVNFEMALSQVLLELRGAAEEGL